MARDGRQRVMIIGSGWAGNYIAKYLNANTYDVTLVSPRRTSAYTPLLASAACGLFPFSCAEDSVREKGRRSNFVKGNVISVDLTEGNLSCQAAFDDDSPIADRRFDLSYDILIICPGCRTNTFGTPGVAEHGLFMKHVSDAMTLRKMLFDQLEKASLPCVSSEEASALLHVVIVGGGPTGVEITAELSDLAVRELNDLYPSVAPLLRITIFDVAPHILGAYDRKLYEYATQKMVQRGVRIATSHVIEKVDNTHLHVKGKASVPYGILLWVAGNQSVPLVDKLEVKKSEHGLVRILTDSRLRVRKSGSTSEIYPNIFALGDAADVEGQSLPTTAEVALQKAKYLVQQLNSQNQAPPQPFVYAKRRLVTYIGSHDGIAEGSLVNRAWSGREAWLSWRFGSFTWTRSWRNWVAIVFAWIMNALFGRDVMRL